MWRIAIVKCSGRIAPCGEARREFHHGLSQLNWMLSNDIVRNALTPKNVSLETHNNGKGSSQRRGLPKSGPKNRTTNKNKGSGKKNVAVTWSTGSDRDKEAANSVLSQIFRMNRAGNIKIINSETSKPEETNIRTFGKGINLEENGLVIVNFEEVGTLKVPLVKLVERKVALKRFSDEKARQKEKELIDMGVLKKKPAKLGDSDKGEDSVKQIKVSWQIKDDDLSKQKSHEIINQLKKGYKVHLYIADKAHINSKNLAADFDNVQKPNTKKLSNKDLQQRSSVYEKLQEIFEEYSAQPVIEGSVETKMLIKLTPKVSPAGDKDSKQALKEQRKKERQEKLMMRLERKKQRSAETD